MPWKAPGGNGGGPWGGGQNPWGQGPGGSGRPNSPDLDLLLRRAQEHFRRVMHGQNGPGRLASLILLAIVVIWGLTGFYEVNPNEVGVVQRFGRFIATTQPGLNYHLPSPIETVVTPDVTHINEIDLGFRATNGGGVVSGSQADTESLMLTGDENIVDINFSVFWQIKDPGEFLFNVRDPEDMVRMVAESAMREIIGQLPIVAPLSENRQPIIDRTRARMQELLDSYKAGVSVVQVQLLKADPPSEVIDAFNDVQRAKADQERLSNEAQAYQNGVVPGAQGDAQRLIQEAEAYKEQVIDQAQGDAQRFISVLDAYRASPDVTARRLYLDTMEEILKSTPKVIVDPSLHGVVPYLPLPGLQPAPAATSGTPPAAPPSSTSSSPVLSAPRATGAGQ